MPVAVVTGSNRGIGLGFVQALAHQGYEVLASCRQSSDALEAVGTVVVISDVDVTSEQGLQPLRDAVQARKVDLLVLSAGIMHPDLLDTLQLDSVRQQFEVNALGPLRVVQVLRHNLAAATKVVFLASKLATFSGERSGGMYGYKMSKLAVRGAAAALAQDLKPYGVSVITLHPGAVQTDMYEAFHAGQRQLQQMCNGQHGSGLTERNRDSQTDQGHGRPKPLTVSESVAGMLQCIDSLTLDESGCFCSWTGETLD